MMKITALTDVMDFGKHRGKTIEQVVECDPSYIVWMHDSNVRDVSDDIYHSALEALEEHDQYDLDDIYDDGRPYMWR